MDRTTQQNASLVEEAAAASETLQRQAAGLAGAVRVFRLDEAAPGRAREAAPGTSPALSRLSLPG